MSLELWLIMAAVAAVALLIGYLLARQNTLRAQRNEQPPTVEFTVPVAAYDPPAAFEQATRNLTRSITGPVNSEALLAELHDDPQNMGYARFGQNYQALADLLNAHKQRSIPNPAPRLDVPVPLDMTAFMAALTSDEALKIYAIGTLKANIERAVRRNDRVTLAAILKSIQGMFSPDTQQRLQDILLTTLPDPGWTAKVVTSEPSRAEQLGWKVVTASDIQQVW